MDTFWRVLAQGLAGDALRRDNAAEGEALETEETEEGPAEAETEPSAS